jgi:inorganic triphosphatase YgiF
MSAPLETEVKLEVSRKCAVSIARSALLKGATAEAKNLISVYFDTRQRELRKSGVSLRVRRVDGRYIQTIKQNCGEGGVYTRREWEWEIESQHPDLRRTGDTALKRFGKGLRRRLVPVFETRVRRRVRPLTLEDAEISVALDTGRINVPDESASLSEVEFELKNGNPVRVFEAACALAEQHPMRLAFRSKAERGYALLEGEAPCVVKAGEIQLPADADQATAYKTIARSCLYQIVANAEALDDDTAEAVHQMRVGIRRLRAAISLFADMLAGPPTEKITDQLKTLGRALAAPRELDVFVERVVAPAQGRDGRRDGDLAPFAADMDRRRRSAFADAKSVVAGEHFRKLMLDTLAWIEAGDWTRSDDELIGQFRERPIAEASVDMLDRLTKKIRKKTDKLEQLDPRQRHKLRINAKKLRYGADFFAGVFSAKRQRRRRRKFVKRLKAIQDVLGDLNDIATHRRLTRKSIEAGVARQRAGKAFAAGTLAGGEEARSAAVLIGAERALGRFAKVKTFWTG